MPMLVTRPDTVQRMPVLVEMSDDIDELASEAAEALEDYCRAPWRQLSEQTRRAKLRKAIELLLRAEELESEAIPMGNCGD
jgi:acyl-CoA reductase-like NAD-dependent aldehyde dehydrogenase